MKKVLLPLRYARSYNSAIGYLHKLGNYPDPSNSFFILKLLQGAKRTCPSVDCRLPITLSVLNKLVLAVDHSCSSDYHWIMYKAMF